MGIDPSIDGMTVEMLGGVYPLRIWGPGMDAPAAPEYGIDTETLLITDHRVPDGVLAQVAHAEGVDLITWDLWEEYFTVLLARASPMIYMFNAPFDMEVIGHRLLWGLLAKGRVRDMECRYKLLAIAERGYYQQPVSLATVARRKLLVALDKDKDVRTGFTREAGITATQAVYGAMDAVATLLLGMKMPEQPTEALQTRGHVALGRVSRRGMLVDRDKMAELREAAVTEKERCADTLDAAGIRLRKTTKCIKDIITGLHAVMGVDRAYRQPTALHLRLLFAWCVERSTLPAEEFRAAFQAFYTEEWLAAPVKKKDRELEKALFAKIVTALGMPELVRTGTAAPMALLAARLCASKLEGAGPKAVGAAMRALYEENGGWCKERAPMGPAKALQAYMAAAESRYGVVFGRTDGGKDRDPAKQKIKISKDDMWKLQVKGVADLVLEAYLGYKHCEKQVSTYLDDKIIGVDGRVHSRFNVLVRTGRTSSSKPNIQNIPGALRSMYIVPEGKVLCSIDYSQVELCTLAQHCYSMFGRSRMRELINAEIDLHAWFAGRLSQRITNANDYDGTEESRRCVMDICRDIKKNEPDRRKRSKAGNFGSRLCDA